jgi:hypothetical protein
MISTKRPVALTALLAMAALAISVGGQPRSGDTGPDKRLGAWEKQLVLPQQVSGRLAWSERRLKPSGLRKLGTMARALAPKIAGGDDFDPLRAQAEREAASSFSGLSRMDVSEAAFIVLSMATKDMDDDIRMIMAEIKATNAAKQKMRDLIKELNGWISQEISKRSGSEDIDNERAGKPGTTSRTARPAAKATAPPIRGMALETRTSPVIHLEYVKTPIIPPLPARNSGLTVSGLNSLLDDLKGKLDGMNEMSEMTSLRLQMAMDRRSKFIETLSNIMKKVATTQETLVQNIK